MSTSSVSPASLFGGTWEKIKDRFLLADGDVYDAGDTGGASTVTLTTNEMPYHDHGGYIYDQRIGTDAYRIARNSNGANGSGNSGLSVNPGWLNMGILGSGGGGAHNNMPPYLVVYMWKRTA